jgi:epoxyqueuosine reductase
MSQDLAGWVKAQALALGFGAAGIAPVEDPPQADAFLEWLARGYHGEMGYLARTAEQRVRLRRSLPWARSVVAAALPYNTPFARPEEEAGTRGWISRHAWGDDYRRVVREKLEALLDRLRRQIGPEVRGKISSDSGPILERAIARRAGLGWVGKNTLLLSTRLGSFFVLGELFLDIPLPPDDPIAERCGQCRTCLDACPTQAFVRPYLLDARRCISYLTIELKGPIPRQQRAAMGRHIFGCDICQDVCPYNSRPRLTTETAFLPRPELHRPDLVPLLEITAAAFAERFRDSGIVRPKRRGLLRNVCVALGNSKSPVAVPALARVLAEEAEAVIRAHAAWALGRIRSEAAKGALWAACGQEVDPLVQEEIRHALQDGGETVQ